MGDESDRITLPIDMKKLNRSTKAESMSQAVGINIPKCCS